MPEGEKCPITLFFATATMDLHRSRFEHMKEKDRTDRNQGCMDEAEEERGNSGYCSHHETKA